MACLRWAFVKQNLIRYLRPCIHGIVSADRHNNAHLNPALGNYEIFVRIFSMKQRIRIEAPNIPFIEMDEPHIRELKAPGYWIMAAQLSALNGIAENRFPP